MLRILGGRCTLLEETIARVLPAYYRFCSLRRVLLSLPLVDTTVLEMVSQKQHAPHLEGKGKISVSLSSSSLHLPRSKELLIKHSFLRSSAKNPEIVDGSSIKKGELEEEIDEMSEINDTDSESTTPVINIEYAMGEHHLSQAYGADPALDYEMLWYGPSKGKSGSSFEATEEYWTGNARMSDVESEMLTDMEAQETFVDIQYHTVSGDRFTTSFIQKRKFDLWIQFNRATFFMMEQAYGITRDTDYTAR